jgi:hypothetical protein
LTLALPGAAGATTRRIGLGTPTEAALHLPSPSEVWKHVEMLGGWTPVLCGGASQRRFVDWTERQFKAAGLNTHRETFRMAQSWELTGRPSLRLASGSALHVSGYQLWSGQTGRAGISAPLHYAGVEGSVNYTGAAGKIAVIDVTTSSLPLTLLFTNDGTYPASAKADFPAVERNPVWDFVFEPKLADAKNAGAVGVVLIFGDISDAAAAAQQPDFTSPPGGIPALIVGRSAGAALRTAARAGTGATLALPASLHAAVPTQNLWGVLPGRSEQITIINTHTDGCNALEENGPIALAAMAQHFAQVSRSRRRNTLIFLAATGHFSHGQIDGTQKFIDHHPAIVKRTQATITVEHLGAMEWIDDPRTGVYGPTGRPHWSVGFSQAGSALHRVLLDSAKGTKATRTASLTPKTGQIFGVGAPFLQAGVPLIGYITGPWYMLTAPRGGEVRKLNRDRFYGQLQMLTRCVSAVDGRTRKQLL